MSNSSRNGLTPANEGPRVLLLVAHPDDAEFHAGGYSVLARRAGFTVKFVSVTNGASGHHETWGPSLAERRKLEASAAAAVIGATAETWEFPDGGLEPTLAVRGRIIREIRAFRPDLVLTHRVNDYHPDHRAVGLAVQDASYMVTVPAVEPETPAVARDPVVAFMPDRFTKPTPLRPDVVVDTTSTIETIVEMLSRHESQVFEWLAWHDRALDSVPPDRAGRLHWLKTWFTERIRFRTEAFAAGILANSGNPPEFLEAFEISEYAAPLDSIARQRLFPFT